VGRSAERRQISTRDLNLWFSLTAVVLIGGLVRFLPLGGSDYPLNDGGLFTRMAGDLAANGFLLPHFTTYNGEQIPFAYPPLGLYLAGLISLLVGADAVAVVRWLPAALSTASVFALYLLASELFRSRWRGIVAAAAYALMPRSYMWLIVGGGITRSLGLLLALLALQQGLRMIRTGRPLYVLTTGALGGLTVLSHPQAAVFLAVSLVTVLAFRNRRGEALRTVVQIALAGFAGLLVVAPWLVSIMATHGVEPVLSAGQTAVDPGFGLGQLLGLAFADSAVLDLMTAIGVLGIIVRIARGQWMIPVWLGLTILVDPRAGATYAAVPLGLSVVPVLGELLQWMIPKQGGLTALDSEPLPRLLATHRAASIALILLLFVALRTASRAAADSDGPLHGLSLDHVAAMEWVRDSAEGDATFAVVTGRDWAADYVSEWFPVFADRTSVATVQGSEWRGIDAFIERLTIYRQLQDCAEQTASCLSSWADGWSLQGASIFIPKGQLFGPSSTRDCCPALRETLLASAAYGVVYDGPGATIFAPADR
jgi:hypothetical protein